MLARGPRPPASPPPRPASATSGRRPPPDPGKKGAASPPPFRELVQEHAGFVRRTAEIAGIPAADADDVVQAALLLLWKRIARRGACRGVRAWLGTVTRRIAWAHRRAEKEQAALPEGYAVLAEELVAPAAGEIVEAMTTIRLVREVVAQLEPARQAVFVRFELDGDPMVEIAADLGIPRMTAYNRLRLARLDFDRLLRRRLRRDEQRRMAFLPFVFASQRDEAPAGERLWAAARGAGCALLALLLLDTPLTPIVTSPQASPLSMAAPAVPPAAPAVPSAAPGVPSAAPAGAGEPPAAPPGSAVPAASGGPAAAPAGSVEPAAAPSSVAPAGTAGPSPGAADRGGPRPPRQAAPAPPRRRRNLETTRILLDTADRMAAEGQIGAAEEALRSYSIHAPDDPLPATRAAVPLPATRAAVPLPATRAAVPLPATRAAVPLPATRAAVPLPRGTALPSSGVAPAASGGVAPPLDSAARPASR